MPWMTRLATLARILTRCRPCVAASKRSRTARWSRLVSTPWPRPDTRRDTSLTSSRREPIGPSSSATLFTAILFRGISVSDPNRRWPGGPRKRSPVPSLEVQPRRCRANDHFSTPPPFGRQSRARGRSGKSAVIHRVDARPRTSTRSEAARSLPSASHSRYRSRTASSQGARKATFTPWAPASM